MKISVLVAVYNAEKTLARCLDSLFLQTYTDVEVIAANDASTDNSLKILRSYEKKHSNLCVVDLPVNGGISKARNAALAHATGDVIMFTDSDDWLATDACEQIAKVYSQYPTTDCVLLECCYVYPDGREEIFAMPEFAILTGKEAFELSLNWTIHGVYAIKAEIHRAFTYDETYRTYSDENATRLHYLYSREVRHCGGVYYYAQNPSSVTHAVDVSRFNYMLANERMKIQLKEHHASEAVIRRYENLRWLGLVDAYYFYFTYRHQLTAEERAFGLREMRRIWSGIEYDLLDDINTNHAGHHPCRCSWNLFRAQEEVYFFIRSIWYRVKKISIK